MCQKKNKIKYILRKYYYQICIIYMSSSSYNVIFSDFNHEYSNIHLCRSRIFEYSMNIRIFNE